MSKRYGAATRIFCGLLGTFSLTMSLLMVFVLVGKVLDWPADVSVLTFVLAIASTWVVGSLFTYIGFKGYEPEWWRRRLESRVART